MNRLAEESSPYLLQHASNPVDWYPWGEAALAAARERNCPIFLSIGYSACHWCHVMEHESFDNPDIAALMNERFVNIKVDREERPDLDQIYMSGVMAMTGHGGWPMSVFLTHDLKPFYCGTYWPPEARMNMPGFRQVLTKISEAWHEKQDAILQSADELANAIGRLTRPRGEAGTPDESLLHAATGELLQAADGTWGGFGSAPKFPHPMDLRLLLRSAARFNNSDALHVVKLSCDRMAAGGIYDHLGGGFARYSTDARWLVPHFEKMLYDNALLTSVYTEAFQATGEPEYERVVRETLDYIQREMTIPGGAFCSAQDADSEGEEGKFFVWSRGEVEQVLGDEDARLFCAAYDLTEPGNWEGKNILNRPRPWSAVAEEFGLGRNELAERLQPMKRRLFDVRTKRVAPGTDDKIVVAWNGMMISACALAARVFDEPGWATAAHNAVDYLFKHLRDKNGRLFHTARHDQPSVPAFLDDYACLIEALVELYQTTFDESLTDAAVDLADIVLQDFADPAGGAFYYTATGQDTPIARIKDSQDGATPSGNGMLATALLKLHTLTGRPEYSKAADGILQALDAQLRRSPMSGGQSLLALDQLLSANSLVVIQADAQDLTQCDLIRQLRSEFRPNLMVAARPQQPEHTSENLNDVFSGRYAEDQATAWVCSGNTCLEPATTTEQLQQRLGDIR